MVRILCFVVVAVEEIPENVFPLPQGTIFLCFFETNQEFAFCYSGFTPVCLVQSCFGEISDRQHRSSYLNCLAWKGKLFSVLITSTGSWRHLTLSNSDTSSSLLDTKLLLAGHEKMKISQHTITVFSSHLIVKNCTEEVWLNSRTFSFAACYCPRMDNYHF